MTSQNTQQRVSWDVAMGESPLKGSRAMYQSLPFAAQNPITIDLTYEQQSDRIEYVQAIYIDNSANPSALTITLRSTQQVIIIPPFNQAYMPVLASKDNCKIEFSTVGGATVPIHFLSMPIAPEIWSVAIPNTFRLISANGTNSTVIKASPGQILALYNSNSSGGIEYLKIYDKATAPVVGTDIPVMTLLLPSSPGGAGAALDVVSGINFIHGIAIATTTGYADADTGVVAAGDIIANIIYQ